MLFVMLSTFLQRDLVCTTCVTRIAVIQNRHTTL